MHIGQEQTIAFLTADCKNRTLRIVHEPSEQRPQLREVSDNLKAIRPLHRTREDDVLPPLKRAPCGQALHCAPPHDDNAAHRHLAKICHILCAVREQLSVSPDAAFRVASGDKHERIRRGELWCTYNARTVDFIIT